MSLHTRLRIRFPQVKVLILGICLAMIGLAGIAMGIIAFSKRIWGSYVATGLWGGTVVFAAGTCAIIASQLRSICSMKSYFICSVLGIFVSFAMIVLSSGGLDYGSKFFRYVRYSQMNSHGSTIIVHTMTLVLSFTSFLLNIISVIVCFKFLFYDKQKIVLETTVKRTYDHSLQRDVNNYSDPSGRVKHKRSKRHSKSRPSGSRRSSNGDRRNSGSSDHSHRHRRKRTRTSPSHGSKKQKQRTPLSNVDYENIVNNDRLLQNQNSEDIEPAQEVLLPTAFNEEELPPYDPLWQSEVLVCSLPPNILPKNLTSNVNIDIERPPKPPNMDPNVRAIYLQQLQHGDNLDTAPQQRSLHDKKSSERRQININNLPGGKERVACEKESNYSVITIQGNHKGRERLKLDTVSTPGLQSMMLTKPRKPHIVNVEVNMCNRAGEDEQVELVRPLLEPRLDPEGSNEISNRDKILQLKEQRLVPLMGSKIVSPTRNINARDDCRHKLSFEDKLGFADDDDCEDAPVDITPLLSPSIGSPESAFRPYKELTSTPTTTSPVVQSSARGLLDFNYGGARPKSITNTLPHKMDCTNANIPKRSCSTIQRKSSWKEFLLPSPISRNINEPVDSTNVLQDNLKPNANPVVASCIITSPTLALGSKSNFIAPKSDLSTPSTILGSSFMNIQVPPPVSRSAASSRISTRSGSSDTLLSSGSGNVASSNLQMAPGSDAPVVAVVSRDSECATAASAVASVGVSLPRSELGSVQIRPPVSQGRVSPELRSPVNARSPDDSPRQQPLFSLLL